jgi:hypothetical protein
MEACMSGVPGITPNYYTSLKNLPEMDGSFLLLSVTKKKMFYNIGTCSTTTATRWATAATSTWWQETQTSRKTWYTNCPLLIFLYSLSTIALSQFNKTFGLIYANVGCKSVKI